MRLSRRGLLVGAAAGGGLALAWTFMPRSFAPPIAPEEGETAFGAWLTIADDGVVTVAIPQLEMGQGVTTILPQIVAQELGADWRQIAVQPAPISGAYANTALAAKWAQLWEPLFSGFADDPDDTLARRFAEDRRFSATIAGTTLAAYEQPCREAGASARAMLCMAAAERWDVSWEECEVEAGVIRHGQNQLRFGDVAQAAAEFDPPDPAPVRTAPPSESPQDFGEDVAPEYPRLDLPAKVDGTYQFAGDVRLPGMLYAAIRHGPVSATGEGAELANFDKPSVLGIPGVEGIVRSKRWLAAVATDWWAAEKAVTAMTPKFRLKTPLDNEGLEEALDQAVRFGPASRIEEIGEGVTTMDRTDLGLRYDVMPASHAPLETATVTASVSEDRVEVWAASQAPEQARQAVASALNVSERDVVLYPMSAGGSFDCRIDHEHIVQAALIARESERPIQLIWSRFQEQLAGFPRAPVAAIVKAKLGAGGVPTHWHARIAAPAAMREMGARLFDDANAWAAKRDASGENDPFMVEGAMLPYSVANVAIDHVPAEVGVPVSRMRGAADAYTTFFTECFVDELAERAQREPLSFRLGMLGDDKRMFACLQRAAREAGWDGGVDQSGQGIACHRMGEPETGGRIALVATARAGEGGVRVEKLTAAVDIGRIVNLDIARQQIEGGLVFGLSLAVGSAITYRNGLPSEARLSAMNLPALADTPAIDVMFMESNAEPFDPGEIGVTVAAPAIANALFSATGLRFRRLPLLSGLT